MQVTYRRFTGLWLLVTLTGLTGVAGFNLLLDPAGAFPGWHLERFEPLRYLSLDRLHKAELARRGGWEVIILGSSRSQAGLPATHPFLTARQTCNLSLNGAKFRELTAAFDCALQRNPLQHVILCLDPFMFAAGSPWMEDFPESQFNPDLSRFDYYCKRLLGRGAADEAWTTLRQQREHYTPVPQTRFGFYDTHLTPGASQRELFGRVMQVLAPGHRRQKADPSNLELFRHVVRECRDRKIDLQMAIMPVHALQNELVYGTGHWPDFEKWKTDLVNLLAQEGVEGKFNLWDFTGYAGLPAEPVPPTGDVTSRMKFYFEGSHCTPVFGGLILDALFGGPGTNQVGVKLDRSNLDPHLARMLADRAIYARTNAADIAWVQRILSQSEPKPAVPRQ
jgi:hypothetical protein